MKERALYFKLNGIKYDDAEIRKWMADGDDGDALCLQATMLEIAELMEGLDYLVNVRYGRLGEPEYSTMGSQASKIESSVHGSGRSSGHATFN